MPTWNGDAKLFDDYKFVVLLYKRGSNLGDHRFLVPRLIAGLTGRERKHLRDAGDIDRFSVEGGLQQFPEYLKTKMGIRRHLRDQACERGVHDKLDQSIRRSSDGHEKETGDSTWSELLVRSTSTRSSVRERSP